MRYVIMSSSSEQLACTNSKMLRIEVLDRVLEHYKAWRQAPSNKFV